MIGELDSRHAVNDLISQIAHSVSGRGEIKRGRRSPVSALMDLLRKGK